MGAQTVTDTISYEKALVGILHTLPAERVRQILDYARFIQTQTLDEFALIDDDDPDAVAADEAAWDAQFAASQEQMSSVAARVRAEIQAGKAKPMLFTKDGKITSE